MKVLTDNPTLKPSWPPVFSGKNRVKRWQAPIQADLFSPIPKNTPGYYRFAVMGDAGSGNKMQWDVAKQMLDTYEQTPFASVLVLGDNVYETGQPRLFQKRMVKPYQELFEKGVRFFPILGNHDNVKGHGEQQLHYWGAPRFYQFSQGPVDFFALDTTVFLPGYADCFDKNPFTAKKLAEIQMQWLDKALENSKGKFKVVYGHYPMYSSGKGALEKDSIQKFRKMLEPILVKHNVDLYLAGHDHHYERSKIIKGILHIISGAAGKLRQVHHEQPVYPREKVIIKNQFMLFEVKGNRLIYKAISKKGKVLDEGVIQRK